MTTQLRSVDELVKRAMIEPGVLDRLKDDPITELQRLAVEVRHDVPATPPLESDVWIYRMAVGTIGSVALIAMIGAIYTINPIASGTIRPDTTPLLTALVSVGSGAIGALAGLLTPIAFRR